jgi:hypothetical protein
MYIHTNQRRVRAGRFMATTASVAGIIMLLTGTIAPLVFPNIAPPLGLGVLGILTGLIGIRGGNRWLRPPTPHDALNSGLKGLGKDAHLYHYYLPAAHVLICANGVFTLTTQHQSISAAVENDKWRSGAAFPKRLLEVLQQNTLGNPTAKANSESRRLQAWLDVQIPDNKTTVTPVIVFTSPKANVQTGATTIAVTYADKRKPSLKAWIREQAGITLSQDQIAILETKGAIPSRSEDAP